MPTPNELERLASAANAMRPDWPTRSVLTVLTRDHASRPYRDLAVALAWVAADPHTKTPARLSESGPWWAATEGGEPTRLPPRHIPCDEPGHTGTDLRCPECRASTSDRETIRAIRAAADTHKHETSIRRDQEVSA